MRHALKITAAVLMLALGLTVAAVAGTTKPASATTCIQWDVRVARASTYSTVTPDAGGTEAGGAAVGDVEFDQQLAIAPLPDPEPSIICLIIKPKVAVRTA